MYEINYCEKIQLLQAFIALEKLTIGDHAMVSVMQHEPCQSIVLIV